MKVNCNLDGIKQASKILSDGGIVIFPTDTVYGIGCNPFNKEAVSRIYKIKNRDQTKPLPILTYSKETAKNIAIFDKDTEKIVDKMWPGSLTVILKIKDNTLKETLNVREKIAVRVPNHKCVLELLKQCKYIVGTSANISGMKSSIDPKECEKNITNYDLMLDGGRIKSGGESTIIELDKSLKIHREGEIKKEELLKIL